MEDEVHSVHQPKTSRYLEAGSPIFCFLHSCRKPFLGTCVHGDTTVSIGRTKGQKTDLVNVEQLKRRKKV